MPHYLFLLKDLANRYRELQQHLPQTGIDGDATPNEPGETQGPLFSPPLTPEGERDEAERLAEEILDRILADININNLDSEAPKTRPS